MMRFHVGSIATMLVLAAAVCLGPCAAGWADAAQVAAEATAEETLSEEEATAEEPLSEEEANARAQAKLEQLTSIALDPTPLEDALAELSALTGVQTYLDIRAVNEADLLPPANVSIHLQDVPGDMILRLMLDQHGLVYYLERGVAIATTQEKVAAELEIRVYEISDLVDQAVRPAEPPVGVPGAVPVPHNYILDLIDVITSTVEPTSWSDMGGPATVGQYRGALIVSQNADLHEKVQQLLDGLRTTIGQ